MSCYFALFQPDDKQAGVYNVSFPDLPGCATFGHNFEEAVKYAMDALAGWLEAEMNMGEELPPPSDLAGAQAKSEAEARDLRIPIAKNSLYQLVCAEPKLAPPESITIWMRPGLFVRVRNLARLRKVSVSQFLSDAAREYAKKCLLEKDRE